MTESEQVRFIAERIMGWEVYPLTDPDYNNPAEHRLIENILRKWNYFAPGNSAKLWDPLTSVSDAFQVEQKMRELGYTFFRLERDHGDLRWTCGFAKPRCASAFWRTEETPCRAISLAAIQAVEAGDAR